MHSDMTKRIAAKVLAQEGLTQEDNLTSLLENVHPSMKGNGVILVRQREENGSWVEDDVTAEIAPDKVYVGPHPDEESDDLPTVEKDGVKVYYDDEEGWWY
jgi:hypothetical protein